MAQIFDKDPNSNDHFFITSLTDNTFKAGKNSFVVNCTPRVLVGQELDVRAHDAGGNSLVVGEVEVGVGGIETTEFMETYIVNVPTGTKAGIGSLEIRAQAIDLGYYTGSFAFYRGEAYPTTGTERLPLIQVPAGATAFPKEEVLWTRNILLDTRNKADSEIRFYDFPNVAVQPRIYNAPDYPIASYYLASGSCSGIAVFPKNNATRNFDSIGQHPLYQLYHSSGTKFTQLMEGEKIRIKSPYVKSFNYANYSNNQITYNGILHTDFIATVEKVMNDTTILLDIPFATVSDLVTRANEDSPYSKNNLVDPNGYNISDDPQKQTMYFKKNFYVLSIGQADYEVIYKNIPTMLTQSIVSGSITPARKSVLDIEFNNLRTYCGHVDAYKIYGRSLNSPESMTLLTSGKVVPEENIATTNFNTGLYQNAGNFYDQPHVNRFWLTSSLATVFTQSNAGLISGVHVGHTANSTQTDYIIFKDDTTSTARTTAYISYNIGNNSYWYATTDAFVNSDAMPSASYDTIDNVPMLTPYGGAQENLINGDRHDSNPIKLRKSTMYQFSMLVQPFSSNGSGALLAIYFVSGQNRKQIATIDSTFKSITDELYTNTFFSDITQFGTIQIVPVAGDWYISQVSLKPYQAMDYSIDSFRAVIPFPTFVTNELYEVEVELYDAMGKLAYGAGSYGFNYNNIYAPLKKQFFVNPLGIINNSGGGGGGSVNWDGGNAFTTVFSSTIDGGGG
jgi:hypothetical protein